MKIFIRETKSLRSMHMDCEEKETIVIPDIAILILCLIIKNVLNLFQTKRKKW
jgi:hypothetical protein